jgi:hypothetical protein
MFLNTLMRRLKQESAETKVREAVEAGIGIYHMSWELGGDPTTALLPADLDSIVLEWCRNAMAEMRRPYGLDYVTVAVSLMGYESEERARHSFGVLRPVDFYAEGPVPDEMEELIEEWRRTGQFGSARWLSAVMFSWGDLTRDLLLSA